MKRTPIRKIRSKARLGQPTKAEKEAIHHQVYAESGGRCELNLSPECIRGVLPENGITPWDHWHLVYKRNKRMWGWERENLCGGCRHCHLVVLHSYGPSGIKPCPKKEAA
jgi:hypothetical protein